MNLHQRYKPTEGYTRLIQPGEMGITHLEFGILKLGAGGSFFQDTGENEVSLIVLEGRCELCVGHNANKAHGFIGERPNVFSGEAYRASIPYRTTYELIAHEVAIEVAICRGTSYIETAEILAPADSPGDTHRELIVGETPIEAIAGEAICFYRFNPPEGCASQRIYSSDGSLCQTVKIYHNDVLAVPKGYHAELEGSSGQRYCLWMIANRSQG